MIGRDIQHYRILRALGSGGMGVVYEAEDTRLGRRVALKFLPESSALSHESVERFEREARIISQLSHPNICTLYDVGIDEAGGGRRYLVMELVDGAPLGARIHGAPLPLDQIVDLGAQLADALDAAHAHGVVHRDIKPANILITKRGQAKLLDFGVAKSEREQAGPGTEGETRVQGEVLTAPGAAIGSVNYMSPEQARGDEIDARSDLFSLGLVLYEMATGQQAFGGRTTAVVFDALLNRQPASARGFNPALPEDLERVIVRLLEKDRRMRYQTAADLAADLTRIRRDSGARSGSQTLTAAAEPGGHASRNDVSGAGAPSAAWTSPGSGGISGADRSERSPATAGSAGVAAAPAPPRRLSPIGIGAVVVLLAAAVGGYMLWRQHAQAPGFTERDTIVIADFANTTGDPVFDEALKQALSVHLQQTPFVTILPDQRVSSTLRLMQRAPDSALTGPIARELCQRVGAKATVEGSIASLGSSYVVTLGVHNCQTGAPLAEQQVQAASKEGVLKALGEAVASVRQHLGESLASIQKYDVPVTETSTSSLEALRAFGQGTRARATKGDDDAIPFFKRAAALDPNFAMAYAKLSVIASNDNKLDDAKQYGQKAYDLKDRVSEYERLYITWNYASHVTNDDKLTRDTLEVMTASFPNDYPARHNLGVYYLSHGELEKALAEFQAAAALAPEEPLPIANVASTALALNRRQEAYAAGRKALAIRPDASLATALYVGAEIAHDPERAEFEALAKKLGTPADWTNIQAALARWHGQLKRYVQLQSDVAVADRVDHQEAAAARVEFDVRMTDAVLRGGPAIDALAASVTPGTPVLLAGNGIAVLGALGRMDDVRRLLARFGAGDSNNPDVAAATGAARALVRAADGHPDEAVAMLQHLSETLGRSPDLYYFVGQIREQQGNLKDAAASYRRVIDSQGVLGLNLVVPMARLRLAEVLVKLGDTPGATAQYDVLVDQWKDADLDVSLVVRTRSERAALR